MYAKEFDYHRAESVEHAVELLAEKRDPKLLAGGHGLIPAMKKRELSPGTVVDIGRLDTLEGIERTDGTVRIGALTTHREVLESSVLSELVPVVPRTVAHITGGRQVHNFATIGGNLARAHPGYDYEGALLAAGCEVHVRGPNGTRAVPIGEFVRGACETVLETSEIVTGIELPTVETVRKGGYAKRKEAASGNAIVGVATDLTFEDGTGTDCRSVTVAVNGLQESAVRLPAVEKAVTGQPLDESTIERAAAVAGEGIDSAGVLDNKKASAEYRQGLLEPYVYDAITDAVDT